MRLRLEPATHLSQRWVRKPRFVDTARQAIEAEMSTKVRSMKEAQRGVADAQSLMRIGEGSLNPQSQIATRIQELAIQGANAGLTPEARAAIAGEMGALQKEFERIGNTTSIGSTTLADGGTLDVLADDTGSVIEQVLPPTGPTAANLSGVDTAPPAAAISFASSALSATLSARAQLGTYDTVYARAEANLAQSMENHVQALTRMNAAAKDQQPDSPLARLRAEIRARLSENSGS